MRACPRQLEIEIWVLDLLLMLMIIVSRAVHRSNSPFLNFLWKPHTGPVSQDGRPAAIGQAEGCAYHCRVTPAAILQQFFFRFLLEYISYNFESVGLFSIAICHFCLPLLFTIAVCSRRPADCTWPLAAICRKSPPASKVPQNMKCEMYREKKEN